VTRRPAAGARARVQRRRLGWIVLVVCVITPVFNVVTTSQAALRAAVQGVVDGILITLLVGGYLMFVREGRLRAWFRRLSFGVNLVLSSAITLALFLVGRAAGQVVTSLEPRRFVTSFTEPHLVYALPFFVVVALMIQFVLQMNRMIGASVLRYFIAGVYHRPKNEERIFLFIDLEGSTALAERLGSAVYFELLRRFVDDLTDPVLDTEGEIYQYAGDEVVITWPLDRGVRFANCVRCFFGIRDAIGDILNTAARLQEYAKRAGLDLVASGALLARLELPAGVQAERFGELELRGKEERVAAYGLSGSPLGGR
jgi:adenylate cyclase